MPNRRTVLIGSTLIAAILVFALWYVLIGASDPGVPATAEQQQEFLLLIRKQERTFFEGWVTGDLSRFPAVYYNDPRYRPDAFFRDLIDTHRGEIDAVLATTQTGPIGARSGELAAKMADVLSRRNSDAQWQAAVAVATAEGRPPRLSDMPDGEPPATTPQLSDWVEQPIFITHATVQGGNHASVVYVLSGPDSPLFFHLTLTNVNGNWYVSKDWVTGNP